MATQRTDFPQGTLEMLVLRTLALEPMHGWGLAQRIEALSGGGCSRSSRARCIPRCSG